MNKENQIEANEIEWGALSPPPPPPPSRPRIAMLRLEDFIGKSPRVISEDQFSPHELKVIEYVEMELLGLHLVYMDPVLAGHMLRSFEVLHEVDRSDCKFIATGFSLLAIDSETDGLLGGITRGTIFVEPEARGRGIARDMHISLQAHDRVILAPSHFSEGGYGARLAAHRDAVLLDHKAGKPVHAENLVRYEDELRKQLDSTHLAM